MANKGKLSACAFIERRN